MNELANLRDLIIADLEDKFDAGGVTIKIGDIVEITEGNFKLETPQGFQIITTDYSPASLESFEGNLIPVAGRLVVGYDIILDIWVDEFILKETFSSINDIVLSTLSRKSYSLTDSLDIYYKSTQPFVEDSDIFNEKYYANIRLGITSIIGEGLTFGTNTVIEIKKHEDAVYTVAPILNGSLAINSNMYSAQVKGEKEIKNISTDRGWTCSMDLYLTDDAAIVSLFDSFKMENSQNQVYDIKITTTSGVIINKKVILNSVVTPLNNSGITNMSVVFVIAAEVLYNVS